MPRRPRPLVLSMHVPKTGGTAFAAAVKAAYGKRVAFFYGANHADTHPLLRDLGHSATADQVAALEDAGIELLHGHFTAATFAEAVPDPARYWIVLREPVERTISHYHFFRDKHAGKSPLGQQVASGALTLAAFAGHRAIRNLQTRYIAPFTLSDIGFVGLTERLSESLPLIGLPAAAGRRRVNTNAVKPVVDKEVRAAIAAENIGDLALYSEAVRLFNHRLETRSGPTQPGLLSRFVASIARR